MTNNAQPLTPQVVDAPYNCPHCGKPANSIIGTRVQQLIVFWHADEDCKAIVALHFEPAKMVVVPGVPSSHIKLQ